MVNNCSCRSKRSNRSIRPKRSKLRVYDSTVQEIERFQPLEQLERLERAPRLGGALLRESLTMKKADFRTFYRDAHAVECLTDREKMLMGLAVAMMRLCDP